jgi:hypothetical protein
VASLLSKEKVPELVVSSSATPLFATLPLNQSCTSGVMLMTINWFKLKLVTFTGLPPVADPPSEGKVL